MDRSRRCHTYFRWVKWTNTRNDIENENNESDISIENNEKNIDTLLDNISCEEENTNIKKEIEEKIMIISIIIIVIGD